MSKASVYSDPPVAEAFCIAIAEAAASGLVPVVYRDGGGWTDIASRIDKGLGYTGVEEAAHKEAAKEAVNETVAAKKALSGH